MNRCITCGKIVTRPKAQNIIKNDDHSYLVCCPICEKEFDRNPRHYIAIARSVFGDYAVKAHSQVNSAKGIDSNQQIDIDSYENIRMLKNLEDNFDEIQRQCQQLSEYLENVSNANGLAGLRNAIKDQHAMMIKLQEKISIHAGAFKFVISVVESSLKIHKRENV